MGLLMTAVFEDFDLNKKIIDETIKKAMRDGRFENLPGTGKPLNLEDDTTSPQDMKLANKILKENDLAPGWIMDGKFLDEKRAQILANIERSVQAYKGALGAAGRLAANAAEAQRRAELTWQRAQTKFEEAGREYNKAVLTYNLKVPSGVTHKPLLDVQKEIRRLLA